MLGNLFNQRSSGNQNPPAQQNTNTQNMGTPPPPQATPIDNNNIADSAMDPARREDLSALSHLDSRTQKVLTHAQQESVRIHQQLIDVDQILLGLLFDEEIYKLLEEFNVDVAKLTREIQSREIPDGFPGIPLLSQNTKQVFEGAYLEAKKRGAGFIAPEDVLLAIFSAGTQSIGVNSLAEQGVRKMQVEEKLTKDKSYTMAKKSVLEEYGVDLTQQAREGKLDPIAGRDKEIDRLAHILLRRTKNNPIIIGEAGVGKTAIIEGLAQNIVKGLVPKELLGKRIIQLDVASLVAGASHRGEFEERLRSVIREAMASSGQTLLFIDEIHTVMGAGDTGGAMDASNIIKPHLARGHLQIIGTTTTAEYRKYFEKDKAFSRRFQPIICEEPSEEVAVEMLKVLKSKYEDFHKVTIPDDALVQAVKLSKKYIGERFLPDKAIDLIDEAAADVKMMQAKGQTTGNEVKKSQIEQVVSNWTGIPITKLTEDESQKLLKLEDRIHERLIDQEEAVKAVAEAVRRGRIGLASGQRPIASFIFLGPSGTGKTELAKTIAEILFGQESAMIRLDMSEYMEKHEVAKLIGAPPGYVGYEEGGQLTEAVRIKPYSIVLLDEVEKAHPDVFNILLQILEDGRLTDNKGNTISFKNTIIICTSNIGSSLITEKLGEEDTTNPTPKTAEQLAKDFKDLSEVVSGELHKFFRPELLNRFDDIVIFKPLRREDMVGITKLAIKKTSGLLTEQQLSVDITDAALRELANEGYDPMYGARPLRRLVQTRIENPIALEIIGKKFLPGDAILIDFDGAKGGYFFTKSNHTDAVGSQEKAAEPNQQAGEPMSSQNQFAPSSNMTQPPQPGSPSVLPPQAGFNQPYNPNQQFPSGLNPQAVNNPYMNSAPAEINNQYGPSQEFPQAPLPPYGSPQIPNGVTPQPMSQFGQDMGQESGMLNPMNNMPTPNYPMSPPGTGTTFTSSSAGLPNETQE